MNKFEKQAYYVGAQAALRDMGLSKTAAGVGFLDDLGAALSRYTGRAAEYVNPSQLGLFSDNAVPGAFRQGLGNRLQRASNWMENNAHLTGGLALGGGAGALGAAALGGYALAPDQKPWYNFGMG